MGKRQAQIIHAKRRALERCGSVIGERRLMEIVKEIQQGKAKFIRRSSNRVSIWEVAVQPGSERRYHAVYDNKRKTIVTFLPIN